MHKEQEPKTPEFPSYEGWGDREREVFVRSEIEGGVFLKNIKVGNFLEVETQNTTYKIEKRGEDEYFISGHPEYCPEPRRVEISGSNFGGTALKLGFVGRNMHLEFSLPNFPELKTIITSTIKEIKEVPSQK